MTTTPAWTRAMEDLTTLANEVESARANLALAGPFEQDWARGDVESAEERFIDGLDRLEELLGIER